MSHTSLEVVGFEESRAVEPVRDDAGNCLDLVPGTARNWLVIAAAPNGETIRAEVSREDWKRVVEPLLSSGSASEAAAR